MTVEDGAVAQAVGDDVTGAAEAEFDDLDLLGAERGQRDERDLVELQALRALLHVIGEEGIPVDEGSSSYGRS